MKNKIVIISIFTLFISNSILIGKNIHRFKIDTLEQYIIKDMDWYNLPGLSIGLLKDGEIYYTKGFGIKCIDSNLKVTEQTIFSTDSVTKLFIGIAIMQLYEKNKIDLTESASKYLPYFELEDNLFKKITIAQLLNHTSGLPDEEGDEFYSSWKNPEYDDDALKRYVKGLKTKKLLSIPGEKYNYSNIGYEIPGCVISEASGISMEKYINKNILEPIDMQHSNMLLKNTEGNLFACPHVLDKELNFKINDFFPYTRRHAASGTLLSNIEDICRLAKSILNKGVINNKRMIKESSLMKMLTPENDNPAGMSWHVTKIDSESTLIFHTGGDPGFQTEFILIPEKAMGVVVMTNSWEHQIEPIA